MEDGTWTVVPQWPLNAEASINEVTGITELPYEATDGKNLRRNDAPGKEQATSDQMLYIKTFW